jgi:hypothetical protein
MLPELRDACISQLERSLSESNFVSALVFAHSNGLAPAKAACMDYLFDPTIEGEERGSMVAKIGTIVDDNVPELLKEIFSGIGRLASACASGDCTVCSQFPLEKRCEGSENPHSYWHGMSTVRETSAPGDLNERARWIQPGGDLSGDEDSKGGIHY